MEIKIYSTPTCPYCTMAKQYISSKGKSYENIDVSADQDKAQEMVKLSGQMGVPVIVVDGTIVTGFDKSKLDDLIK
jgi:glutaredoxin-like YruB-family protein